MLHFFNTVAAVSTPRGKGGIAVIRISGPDTRAILDRVFRGKRSPAEHPRTACFGEIMGADGQAVDEGLALFFPAPHSFTGEDVAELVSFLANEKAGFITGQVISVDGGYGV